MAWHVFSFFLASAFHVILFHLISLHQGSTSVFEPWRKPRHFGEVFRERVRATSTSFRSAGYGAPSPDDPWHFSRRIVASSRRHILSCLVMFCIVLCHPRVNSYLRSHSLFLSKPYEFLMRQNNCLRQLLRLPKEHAGSVWSGSKLVQEETFTLE